MTTCFYMIGNQVILYVPNCIKIYLNADNHRTFSRLEKKLNFVGTYFTQMVEISIFPDKVGTCQKLGSFQQGFSNFSVLL